MLSESELT
jgi:serine/threonine-protein phosphatase 2A catalytic subunit